MNPPLPRTLADRNFAAHYEQLRRDWLGRTSSGSVGLTLLLRQGLTAWMRACSCDTSLPTRESLPPATAVLPANVRSQAAVILAGFLLHSRPEKTL
jgi:hypothetical protein